MSGCSAETADLYRQIIPLDIDYSFQTNLEQHLWKQSFYKPIEELRHFLRPEAINDPVANALLTLIGRVRRSLVAVPSAHIVIFRRASSTPT
jgi:hypothetical protein